MDKVHRFLTGAFGAEQSERLLRENAGHGRPTPRLPWKRNVPHTLQFVLCYIWSLGRGASLSILLEIVVIAGNNQKSGLVIFLITLFKGSPTDQSQQNRQRLGA